MGTFSAGGPEFDLTVVQFTKAFRGEAALDLLGESFEPNVIGLLLLDALHLERAVWVVHRAP